MLSLPPADHVSPYPQLELLPKLLNALFKWKWLIVLTMFAVAIPVAVVLYLKTPLYEVRMKFLIKSSRAQVALNLAGQGVITPAVTPQIINSEIQVLKSPDVILEAVAKANYPLVTPGGDEDRPIKLERALQALRMRMGFNPVPDSNVIEVSLQDPNPKAAAGLLSALSLVYLKRHAELRTGGEQTRAFFEKQAELNKERLERARVQLEQLQAKDNIVSLGQELDANLSRLLAMEGTLKELQAEIESSTKEVEILQAQVKDQPEEVTTQRSIVANPEVGAMRIKLIELERQRDELLQRYTPASRFVKDKAAEIATLKASLEAKEQNVVGGTTFAQNRIKETLNQQLLAKRSSLEAVTARRKALIAEKKAYEQRLDVLKDRSFELQRLRGEFDLARDTYFMYEKKAEEARVSKAMDEQDILSAGIVQNAAPPSIALPRNLLTWGPVSAMAGLVLGVALALALDFFNLTIKDEKDVERFLQVPVLATVRHF